MIYYLGLDPGWSGALAFIDNKGNYGVIDCPSTVDEIADTIRMWRVRIDSGGAEVSMVMIEKVHAYYKSSAKSAFTFGENFSAWRTAFASFRIRYILVTPRKWKREIYDSAKKLSNPEKQSFERTVRLFPDVIKELKTQRGRILDGRCDALLIAEYGRRVCK